MQYKSEYYTANRERILAKMQQKEQCTLCGGQYSHCHKQRHLKSRKHQYEVLLRATQTREQN